jgi:hypothetical protein
MPAGPSPKRSFPPPYRLRLLRLIPVVQERDHTQYLPAERADKNIRSKRFDPPMLPFR